MFQPSVFDERIESRVGLEEIKQYDYVQNVFKKIEEHAVPKSRKLSELIIRYMTARRTLQDNTLLLQTITFHTKKEKFLKLGTAYAEILAEYVQSETFLWEKWFKKLQSRKTQLCDAFLSILVELLEVHNDLTNINKDVAEMIDITYRYF